jgi:hypothetical protein
VNTIILRGLALAAVALLAAVIALAATNVRDERAASTLPEPVGLTYQAVAGPVAAAGRTTSCGGRVTPTAAGVMHPVLPCGTKIFISYEGRQVLTHVIHTGAVGQGRQFEVTQPLAERLGLDGIATIRWRYARAPEAGGG